MADELFDIVNEDNIVVAQAPRSVAHRDGLWHRGVDIFLFTPDGKLLVQKRSPTKDTFPSALECSVGEHVQAGEDYTRAAVRGLSEELGLAGITLVPLMEFSMRDDSNDNEINQLFEGMVDPVAVRFDPNEIASVAYYTLAELGVMLDAGDVPFSRWFKQLVYWYLGKPNALHIRQQFNSSSLKTHHS